MSFYFDAEAGSGGGGEWGDDEEEEEEGWVDEQQEEEVEEEEGRRRSKRKVLTAPSAEQQVGRLGLGGWVGGLTKGGSFFLSIGSSYVFLIHPPAHPPTHPPTSNRRRRTTTPITSIGTAGCSRWGRTNERTTTGRFSSSHPPTHPPTHLPTYSYT